MNSYWGEVIQIYDETEELQRIKVQIEENNQTIPAIYYKCRKDAHDRCEIGMNVSLNTTAIDLDLGTGGYAFVIQRENEARTKGKPSYTQPTYPGHIIKVRYTPIQTPVLAIEAPESEEHSHFQTPFSLEGKRVFVSELHSVLPIWAGLIATWQPNRRIVYIMDDQASLVLSFSDHIRELKKRCNIKTITYGQAIGGDVEAVNVYTALEAAFKVLEAEDVIITQGPGVVGTGTNRGFSGMNLAHWIHAIHSSGGEAIVIPRVHLSDKRKRHQAISHHTLEPLLSHTFVRCHVPVPDMDTLPVDTSDEMKDRLNHCAGTMQRQLQMVRQKHDVHLVSFHQHSHVKKVLEWYGKPIQTMGRGFEEEPLFFYCIEAALLWYKMG